MIVCIDPGILGMQQYLCVGMSEAGPTSIKRVDSPPEGSWILGDIDADLSIDLLAHVSGVSLPELIPLEHQQSLRYVLGGSFEKTEIPWHWVLPDHIFKTRFRELLGAVWRLLDTGSMDYYTSVIKSTRSCLGRLERASIDRDLWDELGQETSENRKVLKSFAPDASGFAEKATYNLDASLTGRMSIKSGPEILRLRRDLRQIIRSQYEGGSLFFLDFTSLEPRIALAIQGINPPRDIHSYVSSEILKGEFERPDAKHAVNSIIYGSGPSTLAKALNISTSRARKVRDSVSKYMGVTARTAELVREANDTGKIINPNGRVILASEAAPHQLFNYLIQSTGVDVAMTGFSQVCDLIDERNFRIRPIFVIHDALVLDVHPNDKDNLIELSRAAETISGFDVRFFTSLEEL